MSAMARERDHVVEDIHDGGRRVCVVAYGTTARVARNAIVDGPRRRASRSA